MGRWDIAEWMEEKGQIEKGIGPFLGKRMQEKKTYVLRTQLSTGGDKETKARSIQARASMGKLFVPHRAIWASDFIDEVSRFPAGKYDDIVDCLGLIGRMLEDMVPGSLPSKPESDELNLRKTTQGEYFKYHKLLRKYGGGKQVMVV
jgi:predicted phage terminase large subunit-like protein